MCFVLVWELCEIYNECSGILDGTKFILGIMLFVFLSVFPNHNVILADLFFLLFFVMLFVFLSEANITCGSVNSMRLHELSSKIRKILRHCNLKVFPITMLYYRGDVYSQILSIFLNSTSFLFSFALNSIHYIIKITKFYVHTLDLVLVLDKLVKYLDKESAHFIWAF